MYLKPYFTGLKMEIFVSLRKKPSPIWLDVASKINP